MWYEFVGWATFWIGLIVAIVLFAKFKKLYPVLYLVSICLYIFSISFWIDVFSLGKNAVMAILAVSAVIFLVLGFYFSKFHLEK